MDEEAATPNLAELEVIHEILEYNRKLREQVTVSDDPDKPLDRERVREIIEMYKSQLEVEATLIRNLVNLHYQFTDLADQLREKFNLK